jgi:hypothetical protein
VSSEQAYVLNATVVPPGALGYLTLWPEGSAQPMVSTLNTLDGSITSNMAIVPANGQDQPQPNQSPSKGSMRKSSLRAKKRLSNTGDLVAVF